MSYLRARPELLERYRAGERAAMAEVYRAYLPRLVLLLRRGFIIRATGSTIPGVANPDDLAEILQEVFERAFKREARVAYDGRRDYAPYLAVVARNAVVSRHRRHKRELLTLEPRLLEAEHVMGLEDDGGIEPCFDPRSLQIARQYVSTLMGASKAVHTARYVEALSQREAAKRLGLSRPKVRKVEDRLRRELQRLLNQAGLFAPERDEAKAETTDRKWTTRLKST